MSDWIYEAIEIKAKLALLNLLCIGGVMLVFGAIVGACMLVDWIKAPKKNEELEYLRKNS